MKLLRLFPERTVARLQPDFRSLANPAPRLQACHTEIIIATTGNSSPIRRTAPLRLPPIHVPRRHILHLPLTSVTTIAINPIVDPLFTSLRFKPSLVLLLVR